MLFVDDEEKDVQGYVREVMIWEAEEGRAFDNVEISGGDGFGESVPLISKNVS